jgi:hypothetical protein
VESRVQCNGPILVGKCWIYDARWLAARTIIQILAKHKSESSENWSCVINSQLIEDKKALDGSIFFVLSLISIIPIFLEWGKEEKCATNPAFELKEAEEMLTPC